jgi:hypothetical protein
LTEETSEEADSGLVHVPSFKPWKTNMGLGAISLSKSSKSQGVFLGGGLERYGFSSGIYTNQESRAHLLAFSSKDMLSNPALETTVSIF